MILPYELPTLGLRQPYARRTGPIDTRSASDKYRSRRTSAGEDATKKDVALVITFHSQHLSLPANTPDLIYSSAYFVSSENLAQKKQFEKLIRALTTTIILLQYINTLKPYPHQREKKQDRASHKNKGYYSINNEYQ